VLPMDSTTRVAQLQSTISGNRSVILGGAGTKFTHYFASLPKSTHQPAHPSLQLSVRSIKLGTRKLSQSYSSAMNDQLRDNRSAYGSGPLELGFQGYVSDSTNSFVQACAEAANIPIVNDLNTGYSVGVKVGTATLNNRLRRSSSYDSFYQQARNRTNLRVLHDAPVTGIAFSDVGGNSTNGTALPRAIGVSYIQQSTGFVRQARARKEVIISMGAFQSPQLLMVSVSLNKLFGHRVAEPSRVLGLRQNSRKLVLSPW